MNYPTKRLKAQADGVYGGYCGDLRVVGQLCVCSVASRSFSRVDGFEA